jgi:hypothetical protein
MQLAAVIYEVMQSVPGCLFPRDITTGQDISVMMHGSTLEVELAVEDVDVAVPHPDIGK